MTIARAIKRRAQAALPPVIFLSLVGYFVWNSMQGDRGMKAAELRERDLIAANADLVHAAADVAAWDRRVTALRTNRLDVDVLDERARAMLNLANPNDIVIYYGNGKKLF